MALGILGPRENLEGREAEVASSMVEKIEQYRDSLQLQS
jgi:hypothetical protein